MPMRTAVTCLVLCFASPTAVWAQSAGSSSALIQGDDDKDQGAIYSWVDGRGAWHFVDSLDLVPPRYLSQAQANATRTRQRTEADESKSAPTSAPPPVKRVEPTSAPPARAEDRASRIQDLQRRLLQLEEEIVALEEGSVSEAYLDAAGSEDALTSDMLEELLTKTEVELGEVQAELSSLADE